MAENTGTRLHNKDTKETVLATYRTTKQVLYKMQDIVEEQLRQLKLSEIKSTDSLAVVSRLTARDEWRQMAVFINRELIKADIEYHHALNHLEPDHAREHR